MDDLATYCLHLYRSKGMLYLRTSRVNYDTILNFRGAALSSWPSVVTQRVIHMPPDGVL